MKKFLITYALLLFVLPACQSGSASEEGSTGTFETRAHSKSNDANAVLARSDFRAWSWFVSSEKVTAFVYFWSWTENTPHGIKTFLMAEPIGLGSPILVTSYPSEKAQVEKLSDVDKMIESFPPYKRYDVVSKYDLASVKAWFYRTHYQQTSRCRSSQYWKQIVSNDPSTRGSFMIARRFIEALDGAKNYNFTIGLEIDAKTLKAKGLSVLTGSSIDDAENDKYIGATDDRVIWGGSLTAPLGFSIFADSCNDIYETLLGMPVPSYEHPPYNASVDDVASRKLDWELGSQYDPLKPLTLGDYVEQNISDAKNRLEQSTVLDTKDPLYLEIQKKENSNE